MVRPIKDLGNKFIIWFVLLHFWLEFGQYSTKLCQKMPFTHNVLTVSNLGRDDRIWTCDPTPPRRVRYRAAPHPDWMKKNYRNSYGGIWVVDTGLEPVTSAMSMQRSKPTELIDPDAYCCSDNHRAFAESCGRKAPQIKGGVLSGCKYTTRLEMRKPGAKKSLRRNQLFTCVRAQLPHRNLRRAINGLPKVLLKN